jgi:hypothetical protein
MGYLDPDPGGQKMTKNIEKVNKFHFLSAGWLLLGLKASPVVWRPRDK